MKKWLKIEDLLKEFKSLECDRTIKYVCIHHTLVPNHTDWHGDKSANGIKTYWLNQTAKLGWHNPLGASFIVAPGGQIYQPFSLSQVVNANSDGEMNHYAVSMETVGNFDIGHDKLVNPQRHALFGLVGGVLARFGLKESCIHYHSQFSAKSCPGSGFMKLDDFRTDAIPAKGWAEGLMNG